MLVMSVGLCLRQIMTVLGNRPGIWWCAGETVWTSKSLRWPIRHCLLSWRRMGLWDSWYVICPLHLLIDVNAIHRSLGLLVIHYKHGTSVVVLWGW